MIFSNRSSHGIKWTKWLVVSLIFGSLCFIDPSGSAQAIPGAFDQIGLQSQTSSPSSPGSIWQIVTLDEYAKPGQANTLSLVMDASDEPHLSYARRPPGTTNTELKYVHHTVSGWIIEQVDSGWGNYSSMVLDSSGYPHIAYYTGGITYAYKDNSGWHYESVDSSSSAPSLKLDSNNYPYISYYKSASQDLRYAYKDASGWHILTADSDADVGLYSSLALIPSSYNFIVYYDKSHGDLKIVGCTSFCTTPGTIDTQGDVGLFPSLVFTPPFNLYLSYIDATQFTLKYGYFVIGWTIQSIPYPKAMWGDTSLAIDSKGFAHIAVDDTVSNGEILYFSQGLSNTWQVETVAVTQNVAFDLAIALALDSHDIPHIAFINDELEQGQPKYRLSYATRFSAVFLPLVEK
jgi:hypothetical protein